MIRVAAALAAFLVLVSAAVARGGPGPLNFQFGSSFQQGPRFDPIEQQSSYSDCCTTIQPDVVNGTVAAGQNCFWDINDHFWQMTTGYLDPGASTSSGYCFVEEPSSVYRCLQGTCAYWSMQRHRVGTEVWSTSPDLLVTDCFTVPARCFTAAPVWDQTSKRYHYANCAWVIWRGGTSPDPMVQPIANSNGGVGVVTQVTETVSNPTGRRVRDIQAAAGFSSDVVMEGGCHATLTSTHSEYPFGWLTP